MMHDELKRYFDERGITQQQVADALGVSLQYVNQLLNGRKTLGKKNADRLANLYGLSKPFLLTGEGELLASDVKVKPFDSHKDKLIASLEKQIADQEKIIKLLEQKIEMLEAMEHIDSDNSLRYYPFPVGVADDKINIKDNKI